MFCHFIQLTFIRRHHHGETPQNVHAMLLIEYFYQLGANVINLTDWFIR